MARGGKRGRPRQRLSLAAASDAIRELNEGESNGTVPTEVVITRLAAEAHTEVITSFASPVDFDEGTTLKFVPPLEVNGQSCAKIERSDRLSYWSTVVICGALESNPPLEVIKGFVHRIWAGMEINNVLLARKCIFIIRFPSLQDKNTVPKKGIYFFDKRPFIVKAWNEGLMLDVSALQSLPI
ncbi:hypothetical protein Cgig2_015290 [Carnegiea gigantea]|uniref:DUF4283 domain-containing protein n=1 Tax=Carnegiea gigantea TaxID=171969 RepID=A0A9Q1K8L5_9CARY|nr:hypothetical protein Cgig2_015290 [Carnegiea gigantea]